MIQCRFGEIAFTMAEMAAIKPVNGITNRSARGKITAARQK